MNRLFRLPTLVLALLVSVSGRAASQTPPTAAQKAEVAARIASAESDSASNRPSDASFPAPRKFNHNHKISSTFDRFKNRTAVTAEVISSGLLAFNLVGVDAAFGFQGKELVAVPQYVAIIFRPRGYPGDWQYLKDHTVNFLIDDNIAIDAGETFWDGEVSNDRPMVQTHEVITALLPVDRFLQLVNGKKVEARVGTRVIAFKDDQVEVLRDLASRMLPERKAP